MQVDIDRLFSDEDSFLSHISIKTDRDIEIISKNFRPKADERTFLTLPIVTLSAPRLSYNSATGTTVK